MPEAVFILRVSLGVVFLASSIGKLRNPRQVVATVERVGAMFVSSPKRAVVLASVATTIATELFLAMVFLGGGPSIVAAVVAIALLALFAAVAVAAIRREASIDCHCFGTSDETLGARTLSRALLLLAAALAYLKAAASGAAWWTPSAGEEGDLLRELCASLARRRDPGTRFPRNS